MNWQKRLTAFFHIQPGEGRMVGLILLVYLFLGVAFTLADTAAYALFLDTFGPEGLPLTYVGISIGVSVITFIYLRLSHRMSLTRLLLVNLLFLLGTSLVVTAGYTLSQASWLAFILPIWAFGLTNLGNIIIWSLVGCLFDLRQSKRLFGVVSSGRWFAATLIGLLIPSLVRLVGTVNLLWFAVASLVAALWLLTRTLRTHPEAFKAETSASGEASSNLQRDLLKNPFVILIFAEALIWVIASFLNDNIYYTQTALRFPDSDQLASFLGLISAIIGGVTLVGNLFFFGRIVSRFGVRVGVLITPISVQLAVLGFALAGTLVMPAILPFTLAVLARVLNIWLTSSFEVASLRILYQPLPTHQRVRIAAISDGIIEPLGIGLAGGILVLLTEIFHLNSIQLSYLLLLVGAGWIAAAITLGRRYPQVLRDALAKRPLNELTPLIGEPSTVGVISHFLQDRHSEAVIFALKLLEQSDEIEIIKQHVAGLLKHPSSQVRRVALETIEHHKMQTTLSAVTDLVNTEADPYIREYGLRALAASGQPEALSAYLDSPEPQLRRGALIGLLKQGNEAQAEAAKQRLLALVNAQDSVHKIMAAQVMGEVGIQLDKASFLSLLSSPDLEVRRAALLAAGHLNHARLWPQVIAALSSPMTRAQALQALSDGNESSLPAIESAIRNPDQPHSVRLMLVKLCGKINREGAIRALEGHLDELDFEIRTEVFRSLCICGYRAMQPKSILAKLQAEAAEYTRLLAVSYDLGFDESCQLLQAALHQQLSEIRQRLLYLLSYIYDPVAIMHAREALLNGEGARIAIALEILDTQCEKSIKGYILPIFDNLSILQQLERLRVIFPQEHAEPDTRLDELLVRPVTGWITVCVLHAAGQRHFERCRPLIIPMLKSAEALTAEMARWSITRLDKNGVKTMLSPLEKVIILKTVSIFARTPEDVLADVAMQMSEVRYDAGEVIFKKGDIGNSLYLIVSGEVRIHDDQRVLSILGDRQVFGEMALLDPAPRIATVTALENTHLLRLGQDAFDELIQNRGEVALGIIRVLAGYLRAWVMDAEMRLHEESVAASKRKPALSEMKTAPVWQIRGLKR